MIEFFETFFQIIGAFISGVMVCIIVGVSFGITYAWRRAVIDVRRAKQLADQARPRCERCDVEPSAYPGARFCGAACSALWEAGDRSKK